jgi:ArsR family transcriptional regulator, arsenate/arsenite/antimonite-responsive transcriptional repressor / arsenate reductase (thioredoxin)
MDKKSASYADVFAALGSEARLEAMRLLFAAYPKGMTVGDLQAQLKIPNSTLSHHLEKLRVESLVVVQRDRQFLWYSANIEVLETVLAFLYNGCSSKAVWIEQAHQALELDLKSPDPSNADPESTASKNTDSQEGFMFENLLQTAQTFLGELRLALPGFQRLTPKAIQSIELAQAESRRLKHHYVGTEQILLGLLAQETGLVAQVFSAAGVKLEPVRQAIEGQIGQGSGTSEKIRFTPRAKKVLELSVRQAKQFKHSYLGTDHLLLGILSEGQGLGVRVLEELGFSCKALEQQLRTAIGESSV